MPHKSMEQGKGEGNCNVKALVTIHLHAMQGHCF